MFEQIFIQPWFPWKCRVKYHELSGKNSGNVGEGSLKTSEKILRAVEDDPRVTIAELAERFKVTERSIERNIRKLRSDKRLCRVGPAKSGYWEIIRP